MMHLNSFDDDRVIESNKHYDLRRGKYLVNLKFSCNSLHYKKKKTQQASLTNKNNNNKEEKLSKSSNVLDTNVLVLV